MTEQLMKRFISLGVGLIMTSCAQIQKLDPVPADSLRSIVKIQAISTGGKQNLGSGVVIAPNTVATNCHVMRTAKRAFVIVPEGLFPVTAQAAVPENDICLLKTAHIDVPVADLAESDAIKVGDSIVLSGFPFALGRRTSRGEVTALHPFRDSYIIEINTGFNHGASGGGVFDKDGKLIGLMTFMGREGGQMHFYVIPETWIETALEQEFSPLKPFSERSFWENGEFDKQVTK
jgi:serine protease Do